MRKILGAFVVFFCISLCCITSFADDVEIYIDSVVKTGNNMTIQGHTTGEGNRQITLLVMDGEEIVYIDQKASASDATYIFEFGMPETENECTYTIMQGGTGVTIPAVTEYTAVPEIPTEEKCILTADTNIQMSLTNIVISGTVTATREVSADIELLNVTDNTMLLSNHISWTDGESTFSVTIPNIHQSKTYRASVVIKSRETGEEIGRLSLADISTSLLTISVNGEASVSDGYYITGNMKSVNTGLIDKTTTFSSSESFDFTIPNAIISTYDLDVKVYNKAARAGMETTVSREYTELVQDDSINVFVKGIGISDIKNKRFSIEYEPTEIEITDGCLFTQELETGVGNVLGTDLKILAAQPGRLDFCINNEYTDEPVDIILNGLKFGVLKAGNTKIYLTMENYTPEDTESDVEIKDPTEEEFQDILISREYIGVTPNQNIDIFTKGVGLTDISNKKFSIEYPAEQAELIDASLFTQTKETQPGVIDGAFVEILTTESGLIEYKLNKTYNKPMDAVINAIRLRPLISGNLLINFMVTELEQETEITTSEEVTE